MREAVKAIRKAQDTLGGIVEVVAETPDAFAATLRADAAKWNRIIRELGRLSVPSLLGRSSHQLKKELGSGYEREVVHRDDMVLLDQPRRRAAGPAVP